VNWQYALKELFPDIVFCNETKQIISRLHRMTPFQDLLKGKTDPSDGGSKGKTSNIIAEELFESAYCRYPSEEPSSKIPGKNSTELINRAVQQTYD
jgi:hypothetical protein